MRIISVFISILIINSASSQEYTEHVDFTILYYPTQYSTYEFYQLGFYHDKSERFAIGGSVNAIHANSKITDFSFRNTFVSVGMKWYLFPNKAIFVDPMVDLSYVSTAIRPNSVLFRGFGTRGGFNIGYEFNRFSIGLMGQSIIAVGKKSIIGGGEPPSGIPVTNGLKYQFDLLNTGIYFSYKF